MSNVCCTEFTGWVKSFTKLERALTVLEVLLLVILIALLILLVLHLIVCSKFDNWPDVLQNTTSTPTNTSNGTETTEVSTQISLTESGQPGVINTSSKDHTTLVPVTQHTSETFTKSDVKCSWTPSAKTIAAIHYYENGSIISSNLPTEYHEPPTSIQYTSRQTVPATTPVTVQISHPKFNSTGPSLKEIEQLIASEQSDGEEASQEYETHVLALVKLRPPKHVLFGCTLTVVSDYWTLTAASCVEAIEETDSLDSFIMMENYGNAIQGPLITVEDVQVHPLYEGKNKSYDLAALKSATSLTKGTKTPVELASVLDYALLTLAQRLLILGYGPFRSLERSAVGGGRRLRAAHVRLVSARQCAGAGVALRHLSGGRAAPRPACGASAAPLCAGVLYSRALPCNYCAGAPLLTAREGAEGGAPVLLALLAGSDQCGVSCEPALYVNLPGVADWIDATITNDFAA